MNEKETSNLIKNYWATIKDNRPKEIFLSTKTLPCTVGKLKYAHFVVAEMLVTNNETSDEITTNDIECLAESYGLISSIFREDPEEDNIHYTKYLAGLKDGIVTNFKHPNPFGEIDEVIEFFNYVGECIFEHSGRQIGANKTLGSAVYAALLDKSVKDADIDRLIEITNSSLTRSVEFPDRKENDECIFV